MNAKKAKKEEFLELYDRHSAAILRHIYFRINNWELAEDLTQEAFLKTWSHIAGDKEKIDNPKTFIYTVAHNLIIDYYRRKPRIPVSIEKIDPDKIKTEALQEIETDKKIGIDLIKRSLGELEESYRQIIIYRYIDDLGIGEIGKITNKSTNNISVMIHRALKILKDKVNYGRGNENN